MRDKCFHSRLDCSQMLELTFLFYNSVVQMSPIKSYLRENLLETALCLPLPPLIPRLQIPLVYLQLWCLAGLIVQVHCASGSESTIEPGISKRTHSDDISFIILYHVIKLQKLGMRYGDRGAWADLANSFKKRNKTRLLKGHLKLKLWITELPDLEMLAQ